MANTNILAVTVDRPSPKGLVKKITGFFSPEFVISVKSSLGEERMTGSFLQVAQGLSLYLRFVAPEAYGEIRYTQSAQNCLPSEGVGILENIVGFYNKGIQK